nr:YraN family protein [Allomuricauda sp.]
MGKHNEFGKLGEQLAIDFLLEKGYEIHATNYRFLKAEIDIVAKKDGILAIVEVKSRNKGFVEDLQNVINKKKVNLLTMAADQYVVEHGILDEVRFDLITIVKQKDDFHLEHVKNAFYFF